MLHNRDLSWLGFNYSVLKEAGDKSVPLYERIKYLSIFSSNLDEFFRVRYPSIVALSRLKEKIKKKAGIEVSDNISEKIQHEINGQLKYFGAVLTKEIIPELKNNGIVFYYNSLIRSEHVTEMKEIFLSNILSFIQPVLLEGNGTDTFLPENNQLYFIVILKELKEDALKHAIVNIPSDKLKRFFLLTKIDDEAYTVFIDDIVRANLFIVFPKHKIQSVYSIKFNRDAELDLQEEYSGNLLNKIEKQLKKREVGLPSRFLYENTMPRNLQLFLAAAFSVKYEDMFEGGRYHHLSDLSSFPSYDKKLHFEAFTPLSPSDVTDTADIFRVLHSKDILLHLPYQSYNSVLSFFNQAAVDADVTDIYVTLYRLASASHIVNALISAAKNGKNVVVFIELKARFDEANNIKWSRVMKEAGVRLVYSMPQIKVHSKTALIKKMVGGREVCYAIVSTGNFNEVTAKFYTDHVLMTADKIIINEIKLLFVFLEKGYKAIGDIKIKFRELLVSQFNMVEDLSKYIGREIKKAKRGEPARIRIKVNNLEEPHVISLLYKASEFGVKIELIVRSVCCIVPGVDNLSTNIKVRRIVDRFLEHSRLFIFGTDEEATVFMGSADLMIRNLHHRIEVCVPVKDSSCKKELLDYFDMQWSDNSKSVELLSDYTSIPIIDISHNKINAQKGIYEYLKIKA
ncbi:polyphosphate kinase 1 [Ferruginibacter lapsinanis]|uniref:polyphosphate kinase 1 n=1 Tax=Ferruginibacter lapsinanis TaxID=563172 RepID=UPI001E4BD0E0|nr:polyphosphate kinase 1 [Ferruginibacter lapsinanis]UEG49102.1 polyphosphate kinase 1 [Ferruginibacter lapsinanis]